MKVIAILSLSCQAVDYHCHAICSEMSLEFLRSNNGLSLNHIFIHCFLFFLTLRLGTGNTVSKLVLFYSFLEEI